MTEARSSSSVARGAGVVESETPSPFLHDRGTALDNPLSGLSLPKDGAAFRAFSTIRGRRDRKKTLRGCELLGSRPFEHLHVTATAKTVLCCQHDYERLTIGDLKTQSVADFLGGDAMARLRKWTYGVERAPDDFLCRRCEFAVGE